MRFLRQHWCTLVLIFAPLVFLGVPVFSSKSIGAFDQVRAMAPWSAEKPAQPWDVLQIDSVLQFYPWRKLVFDAWAEGDGPYWNSKQLCGTPLLGNSQSGAFYPPHILLGKLRVPAGQGIDLLAWFHLSMAGLGMAALVRRLGGTDFGAACAGIAFGLGPFMLSWTALASVISTCCWIPWLAANLAELLGPATQGERRRLAWPIVGATLSTAMLLLAGHLQFAAYGLLGAAAFGFGLAAIRLFTKMPRSALRIGTAVVSVAVGCLLAMPQIKPVLEYSKFSHRANVASEDGYKAYVGLALDPKESLRRLVSPLGQGNPRVAIEGEVGQYLPALSRIGANYAESAISIGPLLMLGAIIAIMMRGSPVRWLLLGLCVVSFSMACGSELNRLLYFGFPGWSATGSPGRIEVLFLLFAAALGGLGISQLGDLGAKKLVAGIVILAAYSCVALVVGEPSYPPGMPESSPLEVIFVDVAMRNLAALSLGFILVAGVAVLAFRYERWRFLLPVAALALWLNSGAYQLIPIGRPLDQVQTPASPFERVAMENADWHLATSAHAIFPPNTASALGLTDWGGYDSLLNRDTVAMLNDVNGRDSAPEANGNMMFLKPGYDSVKLGAAGVSRVFRPVPGSASFETVDIPTQGRAFTELGAAQILSDTADSLKLRARGPGKLVLKDRNMPGWTAWAAGKQVPITGALWREVLLQAKGEQLVEFHYDPPGLSQGILLGFIGAAGFGVLLLGTIRYEKIVSNREKSM